MAGSARSLELVGQERSPATIRQTLRTLNGAVGGPSMRLKIAWRNWGQQWRVQPPPNLMSPRYRDACHAAMEPLVKEVVRWRDNLPENKRWLLVGVKVGWESAIGMGAIIIPMGTRFSTRIRANDPDAEAKPKILPGRGYQPIGYAAVSTAGLAHDGELRKSIWQKLCGDIWTTYRRLLAGPVCRASRSSRIAADGLRVSDFIVRP